MNFAEEYYTPVKTVIPDGLWPDGLVAADSALDSIAYVNSEVIGTSDAWGGIVWLRVVNETVLSLPFVEGTGIVIGGGNIIATILGSGFDWQAQVGASPDHPNAATGIFKWRFGRNLLIPAIATSSGANPTYEPDPDQTKHVEIPLPVGLSADSNGSFDLLWPNEVPQGLSLPKCFIGETGVMVEVQNLILRLGSEPIPALYAPLSLSDSWRGVLVQTASVQFPPDLGNFTLALNNAAIGSGGFSGTISGAINKPITLFGGFNCTLESADIAFVRNSITKFQLVGTLEVPFFEDSIKVKIGLAANGDFVLALATGTAVPLNSDFF